jgi:hypothetical protein
MGCIILNILKSKNLENENKWKRGKKKKQNEE